MCRRCLRAATRARQPARRRALSGATTGSPLATALRGSGPRIPACGRSRPRSCTRTSGTRPGRSRQTRPVSTSPDRVSWRSRRSARAPGRSSGGRQPCRRSSRRGRETGSTRRTAGRATRPRSTHAAGRRTLSSRFDCEERLVLLARELLHHARDLGFRKQGDQLATRVRVLLGKQVQGVHQVGDPLFVSPAVVQPRDECLDIVGVGRRAVPLKAEPRADDFRVLQGQIRGCTRRDSSSPARPPPVALLRTRGRPTRCSPP